MIDEKDLKYMGWKATAHPVFSHPETEDHFPSQTA